MGENAELSQKLKGLSEEYQSKLVEYMNDGGDFDDESEQRRLRDDFVQSFKRQRAEMEAKMELLRSDNQSLLAKNRGLVDKAKDRVSPRGQQRAV